MNFHFVSSLENRLFLDRWCIPSTYIRTCTQQADGRQLVGMCICMCVCIIEIKTIQKIQNFFKKHLTRSNCQQVLIGIHLSRSLQIFLCIYIYKHVYIFVYTMQFLMHTFCHLSYSSLPPTHHLLCVGGYSMFIFRILQHSI